jgi:hypothetical protein
MQVELQAMADSHGLALQVHPCHVPEAMNDLNHGHADVHHQKIAAAVGKLPPCDVVLLAQFSMAAAQRLAQQRTTVPVLSSPDCAVIALRQRMLNV